MAERMTPEEIQERIDEYTAELDAGRPITQELRDSLKDATVGIRGYSAQLTASKTALGASFGGLIKSTVDGNTSATAYNDLIKSAAKVTADYAQQIPVFGNAISKTIQILGSVATAMTEQADKEFKLFQDLSRSGLASGMDDAFKNLQNAGFTMKEIGEFGEQMKQNSTILASMGGTAQEGLSKFTNVVKGIKNSELDTNFRRLGMEIPGINAGVANYIKFQQMGGQSISKDEEEIRRNSVEFMMQQDKLTKLTGMSADQQNKIRQDALAQQQYAAIEFALQEEARQFAGTARGEQAKKKLEFNQSMLVMAAKAGPETKKNAQLYLAGALNSEGAQIFQRSFSETAEYVAKGGTEIGEAANRMSKDAKTSIDTFGQLAQSGNYDKFMGPFGEAAKLASMSNVDMAKAAEEAATQQKNQIDGTDKNTADMVSIAQQDRDTSQSLAQGLHATMGPVVSGLKLLSSAAQQAAGVLGQAAGKEGQIGGGTTLVDKTKSAVKTAAISAADFLTMGLFSKATSFFSGGEIKPPTVGKDGYTGGGDQATPNMAKTEKPATVKPPATPKGYAFGGYTGDGGKYEPAGIVHKGEYVIDAQTTKALGLDQTVSSGPGYADGGLVGPPKSSAKPQEKTNPALPQLTSKLDSYKSIIDRLTQKVNNISGPGTKPTGKQSQEENPALQQLNTKLESYKSLLDRISGVPNRNRQSTNTPTIDSKLGSNAAPAQQNQFDIKKVFDDGILKTILTGLGKKITGAAGTPPTQAGSTGPVNKPAEPIGSTPNINIQQNQAATPALVQPSATDESTDMKKLSSSILSFKGMLDLSSSQIKGAKGNITDLTDSYSNIMNNQREDTDELSKTLETAINPVIKSFASLTLSSNKLATMFETTPMGGEQEGEGGGILTQTKNLILSTVDKIKQSLGLKSSGSGIVGGAGDTYQFGKKSAGSSGGSAGSSADGGASSSASKEEPTHPAGPTTPPPAVAPGEGGTGKEAGVKPDVLAKKAALEAAIGKKLTVTSGFRQGAANHGTGDAIDLGFGANQLSEAERNKLFTTAIDLGFNGIGAEFSAPGGAHIHLDTSHSSLIGWGSDYTSASLPKDSPFLAQEINNRRSGGGKKPSADIGDVLSGPKSGYEVQMHGKEAIAPMVNDKVPVKVKGRGASNSEQIAMLGEELTKLNTMADLMKKQNALTERILQNQA